MTTAEVHWEMGSFFHLETCLPRAQRNCESPECALFSTGRAALKALLQRISPDTVYLPSYYCHEVTDALGGHVPLRIYEDTPWGPPLTLELGDRDAAVTIEYFGMRSNVTVKGGAEIQDRTHLPSSHHSYGRHPDYVVGSLRKTLPVPDGGFVWSPRGLTVPRNAPINESHRAAAMLKLSGMALKASYLAGTIENKLPALEELRESEALFHSVILCEPSSYTRHITESVDQEALAYARVRNIQILLGDVENLANIEIRPTPAYAIAVFRNQEARDRARVELVRNSVYPAVLWELPQSIVSTRSHRLSERTLAIHADYRYDGNAMHRLAGILKAIDSDLDKP